MIEASLKTTILLAIIMTVVAMITYLERKLLALIQLRKGPSIVGPVGLFQPIADCVKLLCKQILWPQDVSKFLFCIPPFTSITCTLLCFLFIPFPYFGAILPSQYSLLFVFGLSMLSSFGECLPGLIMPSKYSQYGSYRAITQVLSYELCLALCILNVGILSGGYNFEIIISKQSIWNVVPLPHVFVIFIAAGLAEGNRTPFDTLEAEQELIAGYHTEYSSVLFCVFYINEYTKLLLLSIIGTLLFFGGFNENSVYELCLFFIKVLCLITLVIITRGVLPRYRFNDIIRLFWKRFVPILFVSALILMILLR